MTDPGESFDASVGLAFSLKAFEAYRKSGQLSAEIRALPGIRGKCMAYLEISQGKVISCYLIDKAGERHPGNLQLLMQLDAEKGPFNWIFRGNTENTFDHAQAPHQPSETRPLSPIPQPLVQYLDPWQTQQWTPQQQQYLHAVFSLINGQRSIDEIKTQLPLPASVVDEVIRILLQLRAIAIQ